MKDGRYDVGADTTGNCAARAVRGGHGAFGDTGPYERIDRRCTLRGAPLASCKRGNRRSRSCRTACRRDGPLQRRCDLSRPCRSSARQPRAALRGAEPRGNRIAMRSFSMAPFDLMRPTKSRPEMASLLERGWCIAWCGWQWDVPHRRCAWGLARTSRPEREPQSRWSNAATHPARSGRHTPLR